MHISQPVPGSLLSAFLMSLFSCLFFAGPVSQAPAAARCDVCREALSGRFMVYTERDGSRKEVCPKCEKHAPRCTLCSIPTRGSRTTASGEILCQSCRSHAVTCHICEKIARNGHTEYRLENGARQIVCASCMKAAPRCNACEVPKKPTWLTPVQNGEEHWCARCLELSPKCTLCQEPIRGKSWGLEFTGGQWCDTCFQTHQRCYFCQKPMEEAARTAHAGHGMCAECSEHAVSGQPAVAEIAREIQPRITRLLGRGFSPPPAEVVTLGQLRLARAETHGGDYRKWFADVPDMAHELGLFTVNGRKTRVLILDHLPEDSAWETIAHELAHAWQHEHFPQVDDPLIAEGFAQWVADRICHDAYRRSGLERMRGRNDVYGYGLRVMQMLEDQGGVPMIINALETNSLPDWVLRSDS